MSFAQILLHHPRKLLLRRALFQVHLWTGLFLSLYVLLIALTGALLVFRAELTRAQLPRTFTPFDPTQTAAIPTVLARVQAAYPAARITNLTLPNPVFPAFLITATTPTRNPLTLLADPATAALSPQTKTWLDTLYDLHVYLLLPHACGMQVNGIGAILLLILCLTGVILWWRGLRLWTRSLRIDLRHNWRRITFDTHSAIGIWTLLLVSWWSVSGIYFGWYRQVTAAVAAVSPLIGMTSPKLPPPLPATPQRVSLDTLLAAIHHASPTGRLYSLSDPTLTGTTVYALVDLRAPADFSHRDIVTLSTTDARVLTLWHYGQNHTLGDWFVWAMHPIHFGTLWGTPIKILWSLLALSLALLTLTGLLMYWNRYLRHLRPGSPS